MAQVKSGGVTRLVTRASYASRKSKQTKYGTRKGSRPPGNKSNVIR
jgi:hypothetical protein